MKNKDRSTDWELMAKVVTGEADEQSLKDFETRLSIDSELDEGFKSVQDNWPIVGDVIGKGNINVDQAWKSQKEEILNFEKTKKNRSVLTGVWFRAAAVIVIVMSFALIYDQFISTNLTVIATGEFQERKIGLPDGSIIFLNGSSSVSFDSDFDEVQRFIHLKGEAFFEVTKDPQRPFIVSTDYGKVTVVGTSFSVSSTRSEETVVYVKSGKVIYTPTTDTLKNIELAKEDVLIHYQNSLEVTKNDDLNIISWKTNHVTFEQTGLNEVFEHLSDVYKKKIVWSNTKLANCYLSAEYDNLPLEDVMTSICAVFNLSFVQKEESIEVSGRGCP